MNLYVAGPMRGKLLYGLHDFARAAWALRQAGHTVFNPIERDLAMTSNPLLPHIDLAEQDFNLREAMTADIRFIYSTECDGVALLPGWRDSRGAVGEVEMANICGKQIFELDNNFGLKQILVDIRLTVDTVEEM